MQYYIKIDSVYSKLKRTLPLHKCQRTTRFFFIPRTEPIKKQFFNHILLELKVISGDFNNRLINSL